MEVGGERQLGDAVALVGRDDARQRRAAQQVGELLVPGPHPGACIDDEHRDLRFGEPGACLIADRAREGVLVLEVHTAGVDQREGAPVPLALDLVAVAGDPGALVHDRLATAAQAVDERGLADVGVSDDRDLHGVGSPRRSTSCTRSFDARISGSPV